MKTLYVTPEIRIFMVEADAMLAYSMTVVGNTSEYDITDNDVKATFDVSDFWEQDEE